VRHGKGFWDRLVSDDLSLVLIFDSEGFESGHE